MASMKSWKQLKQNQPSFFWLKDLEGKEHKRNLLHGKMPLYKKMFCENEVHVYIISLIMMLIS